MGVFTTAAGILLENCGDFLVVGVSSTEIARNTKSHVK